METLVAALAGSLERTQVLTGGAALGCVRVEHGYAVELRNSEPLEADGVVLRRPAHAAAELLSELDPELAARHCGDPVLASPPSITLAYRSEDVRAPLDGYGYVVPRAEGSDVLACTWTSSKWEGRAPDGFALLRVYAGRFGGRDVTRWKRTTSSLRWPETRCARSGSSGAAPRPHPPLAARDAAVRPRSPRAARADRRLPSRDHPGLALAGAAYRGVGIPDCIHSGEEAARSLALSLAGVRG